MSLLDTLVQALVEHFGPLVIATAATVLAYIELRAIRLAAEKRQAQEEASAKQALELEKSRFEAEESERKRLREFRDEEFARFREPAKELAREIAKELGGRSDWASNALEAAKLLPYTDTLFADRRRHFRNEKLHLAESFTPYLLRRCEALTAENRHVFLLIDAGTTLYPFFDCLGKETRACFQRGEEWLDRLHLATNNLPGIESLIETGRRVDGDRYSKLAIEDCNLLPGVPVPVFAAVAGEETNDAIRRFRERHPRDKATFVALLVGNWVRIRNTEPRCPVPMARGDDHLKVKQTLLESADEVFVVSPLGKLFVGYSEDDINAALGFKSVQRENRSAESDPYSDVDINDPIAQKTKLISTSRAPERLLGRHSSHVEDALEVGMWDHFPPEEEFADASIEQVPHLMFPFVPKVRSTYEEFVLEFPHDYTRRNRRVRKMFRVDSKHM